VQGSRELSLKSLGKKDSLLARFWEWAVLAHADAHTGGTGSSAEKFEHDLAERLSRLGGSARFISVP
jgi:hypothetical protein